MTMKDRRYANRGMTLEAFLRFANDRYEQKRVGIITKMPTEFIPIRDRSGKICSAKVEQKSKVDFIGRYRCYPIAIEAKNSENGAIRFDRVEEHQADYMDAFTAEPGTIGIVVISFNMRRFFSIPWTFWKAAYDTRVRRNDRKTPVTVEAFGQTWTVPQKFSVRMEELDPSWEIPDHDFTYGIDYLKKATTYIIPQTAT